jgi:hypothetical protein
MKTRIELEYTDSITGIRSRKVIEDTKPVDLKKDPRIPESWKEKNKKFLARCAKNFTSPKHRKRTQNESGTYVMYQGSAWKIVDFESTQERPHHIYPGKTTRRYKLRQWSKEIWVDEKTLFPEDAK